MADKIGLEITPGTEFAAAYQETLTYGGKVFLGDRSVDITLQVRALGGLLSVASCRWPLIGGGWASCRCWLGLP